MAQSPDGQIIGVQPCCLAISAEISMGSGQTAGRAFRRWRALSLDNQAELTSGELAINTDDTLGIVRDKATSIVRRQGYDPQKFILDDDQTV